MNLFCITATLWTLEEKKKNRYISERDTDHNAAVVPSWQARADQTGHKVGRRRAVVPADPGGQHSHGSIVEVQRAAVCGVWVQSTKSCLPDLSEMKRIRRQGSRC